MQVYRLQAEDKPMSDEHKPPKRFESAVRKPEGLHLPDWFNDVMWDYVKLRWPRHRTKIEVRRRAYIDQETHQTEYAWHVNPVGAAYCLRFPTWEKAIAFATRSDVLEEYGRQIMT